jgi:hypothetical protein
MPAAGDKPTRVAADLMAAPASEGAHESRSAEQQLDYWARVGRAICTPEAPTRRRVEAALAGTVALGELSGEEAVTFNAQVRARIEQSLHATGLGAALNASGIATVSLDENGRMIEHHPDGTATPFSSR